MGNHRAHRGSRRSSSAATPVTTSSAGKRRAATPVRSPLTSALPSVLPSAPLVAGVTVLTVSAGGAVAFADGGPAPAVRDSAPQAAGSISAAGFGGDVLASRGTVISRSGSRTVTDSAVSDSDLVALAEKQAKRQADAIAKINKSADERAETIERNQWVLPLVGYRLSATFGQSSYLWASVHTGLDFSAPYGTSIVAVANGTITETGYDGSYGNKTVLTLEDGTEIWYCHQSSYEASVGDKVTAGEVIGRVGSTGNSTGNHLHLEVRPGGGDPVDPRSALIEHGVTP